MDWRTTYELASVRHRRLAVVARGAHQIGLAAMHERAADLLDAEVGRAARPGPPLRFDPSRLRRPGVPGLHDPFGLRDSKD
jgi:hypothetical protein